MLSNEPVECVRRGERWHSSRRPFAGELRRSTASGAGAQAGAPAHPPGVVTRHAGGDRRAARARQAARDQDRVRRHAPAAADSRRPGDVAQGRDGRGDGRGGEGGCSSASTSRTLLIESSGSPPPPLGQGMYLQIDGSVLSGSELWLLRLMAHRGLALLDAQTLLMVIEERGELRVAAASGAGTPRVRIVPVKGTALGELFGRAAGRTGAPARGGGGMAGRTRARSPIGAGRAAEHGGPRRGPRDRPAQRGGASAAQIARR